MNLAENPSERSHAHGRRHLNSTSAGKHDGTLCIGQRQRSFGGLHRIAAH